MLFLQFLSKLWRLISSINQRIKEDLRPESNSNIPNGYNDKNKGFQWKGIPWLQGRQLELKSQSTLVLILFTDALKEWTVVKMLSISAACLMIVTLVMTLIQKRVKDTSVYRTMDFISNVFIILAGKISTLRSFMRKYV